MTDSGCPPMGVASYSTSLGFRPSGKGNVGRIISDCGMAIRLRGGAAPAGSRSVVQPHTPEGDGDPERKDDRGVPET
jgi:hypothetical protein